MFQRNKEKGIRDKDRRQRTRKKGKGTRKRGNGEGLFVPEGQKNASEQRNRQL